MQADIHAIFLWCPLMGIILVSRQLVPLTDTFFNSRGCPLMRELTVFWLWSLAFFFNFLDSASSFVVWELKHSSAYRLQFYTWQFSRALQRSTARQVMLTCTSLTYMHIHISQGNNFPICYIVQPLAMEHAHYIPPIQGPPYQGRARKRAVKIRTVQ